MIVAYFIKIIKYKLGSETKMYELIQVGKNSYYTQSPAKIGLYKTNDDEVYLIDSGNDKEAGKRIKKQLDANGWTLKAIFNTHSNADHIGGNKYLQQQTGCKIYAPGIECDFTNHPILEPAFLYGGYPSKALRHKFLLAQESKAEPLTPDILPDGMEMLPLPGHFFDMVGFRTADDVVYLADCLSSKATLDKYGIGFIYDIDAYIKTLETVKALEAAMFIPAHADATEQIADLAQYNINKVQEIAEKILKICKEPMNFETILQKLFTAYGLTMTPEQYVLVGSTVRSYLSYLKDNDKFDVVFDDNRMLWSAR